MAYAAVLLRSQENTPTHGYSKNPQILHNLCFPFLPGITAVPRETENNAYAKFVGRANTVHYGRCASGV